MADQIFRVCKDDFSNGSECLGVFNTSRSGSPHKVAVQLSKLHKSDVSIELKDGDKWHTADLEGDFGMVWYDGK